MIAPRRMQREEWERKLREEHGCEPDHDGDLMPKLETAEYWQTSDKIVFTVPVDNEGCVLIDDWLRVIASLGPLKPL